MILNKVYHVLFSSKKDFFVSFRPNLSKAEVLELLKDYPTDKYNWNIYCTIQNKLEPAESDFSLC